MKEKAQEKEKAREKAPGKYYSHLVTFKQPWEEFVQALWQRYPNPYSKHVLTEDTISRWTKGRQLFTKRLITKTNPIPKWAEKALGDKKAVFIEESIVNSETKTFVTYNRNITQTRFITMVEKCTYRISPDNPKWTSCFKEAWIQCKVYGLSRVVEKLSMERYKSNARKAELGIQFILDKMFNTANQVVQTIKDNL
ncbi:PREDICTED: PRELI domain-containing protein 1, mitochondrial-like [Amphimedon queenslandica]|uniref:PRELI/MSF1 domain-containing protein n=1 Tax=Amphimedon queenslandica TaxID=400682 RepID=A0A1X7V199_AMPQE|nr:PREDICTED: PRELI domain-containing protein 1, mitochondrial-like [Amphimedon queenslandica]|eukprot:XP_003386026.1 PREDICTED: PRELI domain-containing protein 1, mitochondrial-like [Amphimedon queenslandica]